MGVTLPRLGLGTAPLGGLFSAVGEGAALELVERAWERGIRFFDTAPLYGHGLSELRLGRALADKPRDEYVVATKVGRLLRAGAPRQSDSAIWDEQLELEPVRDYSYDGALRSHEESLERLGLERIDVLHIHDAEVGDYPEQALAGAYRALDRLRADGVIDAVGAGMNVPEPFLRFAAAGDFDCFLVAGRYTLLDRGAAPELLPLCAERGIAVVVGGVLNSGVLAGGSTFDYRPAAPEVVARVRELEAICTAHGVPLAAAALQFPLRHPAVASLLLGVRSAAELDENLDLLEIEIPDGLWAEVG
jgi:D-threo-aldose 1-dehydrogenase